MSWHRSDLLAHLQLAVSSYGDQLTLPLARPSRSPRAPTQARAPTQEPAPTSARAATRVGEPAPEPERVPAPVPVPVPPDPTDALASLRAATAQCVRCKLAKTRSNVVFGEGNPRARVMFIGEAPGFHEDRQGRPFVGPAGQLLDRIIENGMGLRRSDVYIANVNKCRPPENRDPEPDEVAACLPYLEEQVRLVRPEVIVALGRVAARNLLGVAAPVSALRGRELAHQGIPVVVTWHPAYLLRNEAAKADTWQDIKRVLRMLGLPEPKRRVGNEAGDEESASAAGPVP